jgi:hypothetical protein
MIWYKFLLLGMKFLLLGMIFGIDSFILRFTFLLLWIFYFEHKEAEQDEQ